MLFFRIVSLILLIQPCVEAATLSLEETLPVCPSIQESIIMRMAADAEARPYGDILDRMQSTGIVLIGSDNTEETTEHRATADYAFWVNYCDAKLKQEPLSASEDRRLFANFLALIRDPKAPKIEHLTIDDEEMKLDIASIKFRISCDLLFAERDESQRDDLWKAQALLAPLSPEVEKCMEWFVKTVLSKDAQIPQGRCILIGRLVQVSDFLNDLATSDNLEKRNRAKDILESSVIANAGECPDRAIAGLDDMDFDMALFYAPNLEHAIHFLVRQYKKQVIQDCLVEHEYAESAQEYVYL